MKVHWLPVDNPLHTEVLGSRVNTESGKRQWHILDWSEWWIDSCEDGHIFSAPKNSYFHVKVKDNSDHEGCVFRVRCWYAGGKYRGFDVLSVSIGMRGGKLHWLVRTRTKDDP